MNVTDGPASTGASNPHDEEVTWDEDSDSESPSTPHVNTSGSDASAKDTKKPDAPRRSNDQQSQPDSESSYDVVSGATSHTPGSPHEKVVTTASKPDESEEDDWE
jgi:hypothetical protein